jgi:hypothetical protein
MGGLPLRQQYHVVLAGLKGVEKVDGLQVRVLGVDPPAIPIEFLLQKDAANPDIVVVQTAVLIESFLLLPDRYGQIATLRKFYSADGDVKTGHFLTFLHVDAD